MVSFFVFSVLAASASAAFLPPYYGGFDNHGEMHGQYGSKYGGYGMANGEHAAGYGGSEYDHAVGDQGYYGNGYGDRAYSDGHSAYGNGGAEAYGDAHHDERARKAADAEGEKKYSYFTSGSGPEGSYSKGYYGSEGYDNESSKSKYVADSNGGGYKKGYEGKSSDHGDAHSAYDKNSAAHTGFGKAHDSSDYGSEKAGYGSGHHADGWVNEAGHAAHAAHGPAY